jgi:hypothetical protein
MRKRKWLLEKEEGAKLNGPDAPNKAKDVRNQLFAPQKKGLTFRFDSRKDLQKEPVKKNTRGF